MNNVYLDMNDVMEEMEKYSIFLRNLLDDYTIPSATVPKINTQIYHLDNFIKRLEKENS